VGGVALPNSALRNAPPSPTEEQFLNNNDLSL